jgi:hypothetical protein
MRLIAFFLLLISVNLQAALKATISATKIKINQTIQLKLTSDNAAGKQPNLTKLKRNFDIVGSSKVSRPYVSNNQKRQKTLWYFILKPKRSGTLSIPKLSVNGQSSKSINISVRAFKPTKVKPKVAKKIDATVTYDIVVSAKATKTKLYPNEMLVYELTVNSDKSKALDFTVTPPFVAGAVILPLAEASYQEKSQRSKQRIIRKQSFAIFAEQVALYTIDPASITFNSAIEGKEIELKANSLRFEIMSKANQTSLGYWIPSSSVKLSQQWQGIESQSFQVGDTIKRTISIQALGVNADILPLLSNLTHQKMQIQLEDVSVENKVIDGQMVATRSEVVSMTFKSAGQINLAPIDIHWWNTELDQARISSLNPKSFSVLDVKTPSNEAPQSTAEEEETTSKIPNKTLKAKSSIENNDQPTSGKHAPALFSAQQMNVIIIILFALLVATTLGWLISSRKRR